MCRTNYSTYNDTVINISLSLIIIEPRSDYTAIDNYPLPFTDLRRKICLNVEILEDVVIENDESFSILLERSSNVPPTVPLIIEPEISTVKIMDNDGIVYLIYNTCACISMHTDFVVS